MCGSEHPQDHGGAFGFLVDHPAIRELVADAERELASSSEPAERIERLKPAFARLLASDDWLPPAFTRADSASRMGGGIGQYALYRAEDGSLCLFALVVPPSVETPVHDHLAWGIVGLYRGAQDETVYRRLDDASDPSHAQLEVAKRQPLIPGEFYPLIPPLDDIHFVRTTSAEASISIHLLANDTACVWRHRFDVESGDVTPFRSGYANATCKDSSR